MISVLKHLGLALFCSLLSLGQSGMTYEPPPLDLRPLPTATRVSPTSSMPDDLVAEEVEPERQVGALVSRERTRVAVLGYHNFSKTKPTTDMLMRTSEFREQMETIRRTGLTVISMQEFLEWRFGSRQLPEECILITLDDGWRSVYTDAYPILKEYGYPFTLFLYTQYISGKGDSLSPAMIKEMQRNGATIGSHSTSHLYPSSWKNAAGKGSEAVQKLIERELGQSREKLSQLFGPVNTYCYPGGYVTQEMLDALPSFGYVAGFTVLPGKVTINEAPLQIHRYMVFGTDSSIFARAVDFRVAQTGSSVSTGNEPGTLPRTTPPPPFLVSPASGSTVVGDISCIDADPSCVAGRNISTVEMRVSGYGRVPAKVDVGTRTVRWTPPCRIYMPHLSVHVTWKTSNGSSHKAEWSFKISPAVTVQP